jgi:hypothetical protein
VAALRAQAEELLRQLLRKHVVAGRHSRQLEGLRLLQSLVRRPLRPLWRPFGLRFTYVTSILVKKY